MENKNITCTNCGKLFVDNLTVTGLADTVKNRNEEFDKLCSDCQAKSVSLFFGLFSDFKGE